MKPSASCGGSCVASSNLFCSVLLALADSCLSLPQQFDKSMMHTVEEMQAFGNNFVPAPFWVRVIRVTIPLSTRIDAGKYLIAGLGDDDVENVIGGREWWQRTSHPESGVCGEWISLKRDWEGLEAEAKAQRAERASGKGKDGEKELEERLRQLKEEGREDAKRRREAGKGRSRATSSATLSRSTPQDELESERRAASSQRQAHGGEAFLDRTATHHHEEDNWTSDLDDMPVTLAIHGGAHFFGSTNTHRYWYWRLARKTEGRLFSVDYRLSPQFPFPCARASLSLSLARLTPRQDSSADSLLYSTRLPRRLPLPHPAAARRQAPTCRSGAPHHLRRLGGRHPRRRAPLPHPRRRLARSSRSHAYLALGRCVHPARASSSSSTSS